MRVLQSDVVSVKTRAQEFLGDLQCKDYSTAFFSVDFFMHESKQRASICNEYTTNIFFTAFFSLAMKNKIAYRPSLGLKPLLFLEQFHDVKKQTFFEVDGF